MRYLLALLLHWLRTGLLTALAAVAFAYAIGTTRACEEVPGFCPLPALTFNTPEPRDQGSRLASDTSEREAENPAVSAPPVSEE